MMLEPRFSDTCLNQSKINNAFEEYFYVHSISELFGLVKYHTLNNAFHGRVIRKRGGKAELDEKIKIIFIDIAKALSYLTVILPCLMLVGKVCCRLVYDFYFFPGNPGLKRMQSVFEHPLKEPVDFLNYFHQIRLEAKGKEAPFFAIFGKQFPVGPGIGDLSAEFRESETVIFKPPWEKMEIPEKLDQLCKLLTEGFASGKKLVLVPLSNAHHSIAGAFRNDGKFILVDSLKGGCRAVDIKFLTAYLNNQSSSDLHFSGKYINTGLQRRGHYCQFFTHLYCYQIAKEEDLDAYRKVNGAFKKGMLTTFEDLDHISFAGKVTTLSVFAHVDPEPFIMSWIHRTCQVPVDSWEDIPLRVIQESTNLGIQWKVNGHPAYVEVGTCFFASRKCPIPIFGYEFENNPYDSLNELFRNKVTREYLMRYPKCTRETFREISQREGKLLVFIKGEDYPRVVPKEDIPNQLLL